jgi:hypothetical protein
MNVGKKLLITALAGLALAGYTADASDQTDHLRDLAKQAKDKGDLILTANYLCEAASLDAPHYEKKCERARTDAEKQSKEYEADLQVGKFELQHKDYAGAIRDLSKISFGAHRDEAQELIQQAKASVPGSSFDAANQAVLQSAQVAYQRGDFNAAIAQASRVQAEALLPAAKQLLTNIKVYQDTMAQADMMAQKADYKGAREKYAFAIAINANGPGSPADKLHDVEAKLANQSETAKAQPSADTAKSAAAPPKIDYAAKVKSGLADARRHEASGDFKAALRAYDGVLALDGLQAEAVAGKKRVEAELRNDPKALAASLEDGIRNYYSFHFEQAVESISLYLNNGGSHSKGAAHFYLAAALMSEAIVADPHDDEHKRNLLQNADNEFAQARQENYEPIAKLVSPRILAEWTKSGSQQ